MITVVPTDRIYLCCGATDMRRGINGLARMVQQIMIERGHQIEIGDLFFLDELKRTARIEARQTNERAAEQREPGIVVRVLGVVP